jgi:hemolysin activation/secretion protein
MTPSAGHDAMADKGVVRGWAVIGVVLVTLVADPVQAQLQLPPIFDPGGRSRERLPPERVEPLKPQPPPLAPGAPPPREEKERLPQVKVFLKEIRLEGNTVFTAEQLAPLTAPYVNREVTTEDLESLRLTLTLFYVSRGYITSGAVIPDQAVTDGVIRFQIIEGKLTRIEVEGARWFRPSYFQSRLELSAGPPVNVFTLQERLQLLQQDQRVQRINAEIRPGVLRGESELHVRVAEASPFKAWLDFNNYQPPAVRAERFLATVAHENLTGNGDRFMFTYGQSIPWEGTTGVLPIIDTSYTLPFTPYDTSLTFSYRRNDFEIVENPFKALDIQGHIEIFGATLLQPVYRSLHHQVTLGIQGEYLYNKNTLLGVPFDFFAGYQNGVANNFSLRFLQEWIYRTQSTVLAARSRFSVGLDVLDATINANPNVADGQFFSWLGQFQAVQRFDQLGGVQVLGRIELQLANDLLFPLEQFPMGGRFSVRGYREITTLRDNAFLFSFEPRLPIARWAFGLSDDVLQLAPFVDVGRSWVAKGTTPDPETLASVGAGLRSNFLPNNRGYFEIYYGYRLDDVTYASGGGGNLQDHGVHLQVVLQAW